MAPYSGSSEISSTLDHWRLENLWSTAQLPVLSRQSWEPALYALGETRLAQAACGTTARGT